MLSGLTNLFDKNFVIGFLLPVILGFCGLAVVFPGAPLLAPLSKLAASDEDLGKLFYLLLVVWVIAIALMITNDLQQRFLSGYYWPLKGWTALWDRHAAIQKALEDRRDQLRDRRDADPAAFPTGLQAELNAASQRLATEYPPAGAVRPTRFGNAVRAFEYYSYTVYGVDSIPAWARLTAVVPAEFNTELEGLRAQVNSLVNVIFVLAPVGVLSLCIALQDVSWPDTYLALNGPNLLRTDPVWPFLAGVLELGLAVLAYHGAVGRAVAWGHQVKAAFDCYLPDLVQKLGYEMPARSDDREQLWRYLNRQFIYHRKMPPSRWPGIVPASRKKT